MKNFQSKTASFVITLFIGAILISFAFTGFDGFNSTTGSVASVDGTPITTREFQTLLNRESQRYSQMFGGKSLTSAQMRQFRINETVLNQLIQQKLILNLSNDLELGVGEAEIKDQIKNLEFFQSNKKFDVNKYKAILAANRLTPSGYEETVIQDELLRQARSILSNIPVSTKMTETILELKGQGATVHTVKFNKEDNSKFIDISSKEIKEFANNEKNQKLLNSLFNTMASEFNKPEEVKAKHILIKINDGSDGKKELAKAQSIYKKVNKKNFTSIANKETQDPSGKGKGGDLGWFGKGRMVPEFEKAAFSAKAGTITKPIKTNFGYHIIYVQDKKKAVTKTLADVKEIVAKRHLQRTKREELKAFNNKIAADLKAAFEANKLSTVKSLSSKYNLTLTQNTEVSFLDKKVGSLTFKDETLTPLLKEKKKGVFIEDTPSDIKILSVIKIKDQADIKAQVAKDLETQVSARVGSKSAKLQQDLLTKLEKDATIKSYLNVQ